MKLHPITAIAVAVLLAAPPASAEEPAAAPEWHVQKVLSAHRFIPDEPRADPDQPSLRYGLHGGRWKAMAGGSVVLAGIESDRLRLGVALAGFIELINFNQGEPVPWQSYRANVGMEVLAESPWLSRAVLPSGGRLHLAIGWFHESDHAANQGAYVAEYVAPLFYPGGSSYGYSSFNNGNFSSYEYVKLRAVYRQPLWGERLIAQSALGARLFTPSINPGSVRRMEAAVFAEARLAVRVSDGVRPYVSAYFELIENGFVARQDGFRFGLERTPLRYQIIHLGVDLVSAGGGIFSPFLTYSRSHGRGIDFPKFFGDEVGFGIALLP